ncbi:MAG: hypothetical protein FJ146_01375 [Deltaproteobacteria bacterium]|nr:hypothetical protein [Deltaproteobacteria bacterium]
MIRSWTKLSYGARIISGKTALLALVSGLLPILGACSSGKSDFADASISAEAQEHFNIYDKLKDDPGFKEQFANRMALKPDYSIKTSFDLTANGKLYKNADEIFKRNSKIHNVGFNGSYADFLKMHGVGIGSVELRDFQLADDITADNLQANGNKEALAALLKKYTLLDFVRATRAELIVATYKKLLGSNKSAALGLLSADKAIEKGGDVTEKFIDAIDKGPERSANQKLKNACAKAVDACVTERTNVELERWLQCTGSLNDPNVTLNMRVPRQNMAGNDGMAVWSPYSYPGTLACGEHYWRAYCAEGYKKKDNSEKYYHSDNETQGCSWQHDKEKSPKKPNEDVKAILERRSVCEAQKGCNLSINLGNT